jgi:hypothetical protein
MGMPEKRDPRKMVTPGDGRESTTDASANAGMGVYR